MSQAASSSSSDLHYIVILFLVAYLLTSAPTFVREWRKQETKPRMESVTGIGQIIKAGKTYGVDPFVKMWKAVQPTLNLATWQAAFTGNTTIQSKLTTQLKTSI